MLDISVQESNTGKKEQDLSVYYSKDKEAIFLDTAKTNDVAGMEYIVELNSCLWYFKVVLFLNLYDNTAGFWQDIGSNNLVASGAVSILIKRVLREVMFDCINSLEDVL